MCIRDRRWLVLRRRTGRCCGGAGTGTGTGILARIVHGRELFRIGRGRAGSRRGLRPLRGLRSCRRLFRSRSRRGCSWRIDHARVRTVVVVRGTVTAEQAALRRLASACCTRCTGSACCARCARPRAGARAAREEVLSQTGKAGAAAGGRLPAGGRFPTGAGLTLRDTTVGGAVFPAAASGDRVDVVRDVSVLVVRVNRTRRICVAGVGIARSASARDLVAQVVDRLTGGHPGDLESSVDDDEDEKRNCDKTGEPSR